MTIRFIAMWSERVPQKKALFTRCPDASLRFVQSKTEPSHHVARPIPRLHRVPATKNYEIVCVRDLARKPLLLPVIRQYLRKRFTYPEHGLTLCMLCSIPRHVRNALRSLLCNLRMPLHTVFRGSIAPHAVGDSYVVTRTSPQLPTLELLSSSAMPHTPVDPWL
jgi:hypothetical protein